MELLWNLIISALVVATGVLLLLRWLGRCGLPIPVSEGSTRTPAGVLVGREESVKVFALTLLFRILLLLFSAVIAVAVLGREDVLSVWRQWDAWHYEKLVELGYSGYTENGQTLFVVFFPLYVWLTRLVRLLVGNTLAAGLLVSYLCYAGGCVFLYRLAALEYGRGAARRAVLFLSLFPYAFFFGGMMTESLFFLTTTAALYAIRRRRWLAAGLWGALAAMTRMHGLLLIVAAGAELLESLRPFEKRGAELRRAALGAAKRLPLVLLPLLGTLVYLLLNRHVTGDFFGFVDMQQHWSQGFYWVSNTLWYVLQNALHYQDGAARVQLWIPTLLLFPVFFGLLLAGRKKRSMLTLYGFLYLILNFSLSWLLSAGRYLSCGVPFFLFAAALTEGKPVATRLLAVGMGALFLVNLTLYLTGGQIM